MDNIKNSGGKEALKALREERKADIERAATIMKAQNALVKAIVMALQEGAKTVPEISAATGISTAETLSYVATLRKYGRIGEGPKEGDYFKYELLASKAVF